MRQSIIYQGRAIFLETNFTILVTGCAGFIGFHLAYRLLAEGLKVIGLDNMNTYYDVSLKEARLRLLRGQEKFNFYKASLEDSTAIADLFEQNKIDIVVNLAAQAGVRYSLVNPKAYIDSNINGFFNILEACRMHKIKHLLFASSSSVYGANCKIPFSVRDNVDHPVSLYAATKKSNELMTHAYSHLFSLPVTGLRFFTVYGPWGRPDMALFLFTKAILEGTPIDVYNNGNLTRDFTYIEDIIESIVRLIDRIPEPDPDWNGCCPDPGTSSAPFRIYNIGNHHPVKLDEFIKILEEKLGKPAVKNYLPLQAGDVPDTYADIDDLVGAIGFKPQTSIDKGIGKFVDWYKEYYGAN
jgi:UDP-glucuronate 4-epimerase